MGRKALISAVSLALAFAAAGTARAESTVDVYKDKQLKLIISSSPGGGYDLYSRLVARHLPDHLPGAPIIVPQNMPGAGGIKAADYLYTVAPKDGLTIGNLQNTVPFEPMYGTKQATFDPGKFNWLGSPSKEVAFLLVWHTVPVNTLDDAKTHELILGASGNNSTPAFYARVLQSVFGIKVKLINGYPGQTESFLAMEKGENEGYSSTFWSSLKTTHPDWIADKKIKIIVQYALEPHPELKDVPFALDLLKGKPEDRKLMQVASAPLSLGRPFVAPPDVPADRVAALRTAMMDTFKDQSFKDDCTKERLESDSPISGEETQQVISKMYAAPPEVLARLRQIYEAGSDTN
jgi:tripartite-type tricarboxylate transporter receptor subunit TctC